MRVDFTVYQYLVCIIVLLVVLLMYNKTVVEQFFVSQLFEIKGEQDKENDSGQKKPTMNELVEAILKTHTESFSDYLHELDKHKIRMQEFRKLDYWLQKREEHSKTRVKTEEELITTENGPITAIGVQKT